MSEETTTEQLLSDILNKQTNISPADKKPLRKILSSYWNKKPMSNDLVKEMKDKFNEMKTDMDHAKSSFSSIMQIQQKLVDIYKEISLREK